MFPARLENRREGPGPPEERGLPREFDDFLLFSIMSSRDMSRAVVVIFFNYLSLSLLLSAPDPDAKIVATGNGRV
jgi:hypothetical protein